MAATNSPSCIFSYNYFHGTNFAHGANAGHWANPAGQFELLKAAEPVYRLLGAGGLEDAKRPEVGQLSGGRLGYYIREGVHSMTPGDWRVFCDYADRQLGKPAR